MSRRPEPRRMIIGGEEAVVVAPEEYERLATTRRQVGAQGARIRVLKHELQHSLALLAAVESLLADVPHGRPGRFFDGGGGGDADHPAASCVRCGLLELIHRRPSAGTRAPRGGLTAL
ncbi:hypothetical protein [Streptomyces syringium]|uniref:hypothetical protein n=1 Tax=Streptomyces syringium TaxID=76729 RepID=UPI0033CD34EE